MRVLVTYASKHGATAGIAVAIAEAIAASGHEARAAEVETVQQLEDVEAVVVGSALYAGAWLKEAVEFTERFRDELTRRPVWLFSSGPLGDDVDDADQQPRQLPRVVEWARPRDHVVFAGKLDSSQLGFADRMIIKAVKAPDGDYRDWDAIRAWGEKIAAELA